MTSAYTREMERAKRDTTELFDIVVDGPDDLTLPQLMQAIGLATLAHDALLRAA